MRLYSKILTHILEKENLYIVFPNVKENTNNLVEMKCYEALEKIKSIIKDDSIEDPECFIRIEKIILILEDIGRNGGSRYDFG